jgi:hypothetical protein
MLVKKIRGSNIEEVQANILNELGSEAIILNLNENADGLEAIVAINTAIPEENSRTFDIPKINSFNLEEDLGNLKKLKEKLLSYQHILLKPSQEERSIYQTKLVEQGFSKVLAKKITNGIANSQKKPLELIQKNLERTVIISDPLILKENTKTFVTIFSLKKFEQTEYAFKLAKKYKDELNKKVLVVTLDQSSTFLLEAFSKDLNIPYALIKGNAELHELDILRAFDLIIFDLPKDLKDKHDIDVIKNCTTFIVIDAHMKEEDCLFYLNQFKQNLHIICTNIHETKSPATLFNILDEKKAFLAFLETSLNKKISLEIPKIDSLIKIFNFNDYIKPC